MKGFTLKCLIFHTVTVITIVGSKLVTSLKQDDNAI